MKPNKRIDEDVDKTLRSIADIERANPRPFFSTRAEARLDRHLAATSLRTGAWRPVYMLASLGLVFLLNLSAVLLFQQQLMTDEQQQATEHFAAEWKLNADISDW